jgi:DNA-binding transcriptional MerR regulator
VEVGKAADPRVTERTLEFWRNQGLLPKAERTGQDGTRPIWSYPMAAADQLRALLALRQRSKDLDVLRIALWYQGFDIDVERVRKALVKRLEELGEQFEAEVERRISEYASNADARQAAINDMARTFALRRGSGMPRYGRQALEERTKSMALLLNAVLSGNLSETEVEVAAPSVERMLGLDRGRRYRPNGVEPWLDGPPAEGLFVMMNYANLRRLIETTSNASGSELEDARVYAKAFLEGTAAFSQLADASSGQNNVSGMGAIELLSGDPFAAIFVIPLAVSFMRSPEIVQNMKQVQVALETNVMPVVNRIKELAALPAAEREEQLSGISGLSDGQALSIRRMLDAFAAEQ